MQVVPLLRSVVLAAPLTAIAAGAQTLPLPGDAPNLRPSLPVEAYLDWGLGVVGNEVLTVGEVTREQMNPMSPWAARLREGEDPRAMQDEVIRDLAMTRLEVEAGRNRGFDPALVDSLVSDNFERRMELMGGPVAFSQQLSTSRLTPEQFREMMRGNLLRTVWRQSEQGQQPGPSGRLLADRYVRPGELLSAYQALAESDDSEDLAVVGGAPASYRLKRLILSLEEHAPGLEGQAAAERVEFLANRLRGEVMLGDASFPDLVEAWDANRGRNADLERSLRRVRNMSLDLHGSDVLERFVRTARAGEVSPAVPYLVEGQVRAYLLYQLTSVEEAVAPAPFSDLAVQEGLREFLLEQLDQRRLVRARIELVRGSFVHPRDLRTFLARGELASSRGR